MLLRSIPVTYRNMDLFLQTWGGGMYLLNKMFLAIAEGKQSAWKRNIKIIGWIVYILGVPAWVILLALKNDWIAASIEFGGVPAMLFGLYTVYTDTTQPNKLFDTVTSLFTIGSIIIGVALSVYTHHGITSLHQLLELGVMIGFLLGSYFMAKGRQYGWIFFMIMNASMGTLMLLQHKPILANQQLVSLCFVLYGYTMAVKNSITPK